MNQLCKALQAYGPLPNGSGAHPGREVIGLCENFILGSAIAQPIALWWLKLMIWSGDLSIVNHQLRQLTNH